MTSLRFLRGLVTVVISLAASSLAGQVYQPPVLMPRYPVPQPPAAYPPQVTWSPQPAYAPYGYASAAPAASRIIFLLNRPTRNPMGVTRRLLCGIQPESARLGSSQRVPSHRSHADGSGVWSGGHDPRDDAVLGAGSVSGPARADSTERPVSRLAERLAGDGKTARRGLLSGYATSRADVSPNPGAPSPRGPCRAAIPVRPVMGSKGVTCTPMASRRGEATRIPPASPAKRVSVLGWLPHGRLRRLRNGSVLRSSTCRLRSTPVVRWRVRSVHDARQRKPLHVQL